MSHLLLIRNFNFRNLYFKTCKSAFRIIYISKLTECKKYKQLTFNITF
jgi:hypothetical protein